MARSLKPNDTIQSYANKLMKYLLTIPIISFCLSPTFDGIAEMAFNNGKVGLLASFFPNKWHCNPIAKVPFANFVQTLYYIHQTDLSIFEISDNVFLFTLWCLFHNYYVYLPKCALFRRSYFPISKNRPLFAKHLIDASILSSAREFRTISTPRPFDSFLTISSNVRSREQPIRESGI